MVALAVSKESAQNNYQTDCQDGINTRMVKCLELSGDLPIVCHGVEAQGI